MSTLESIVQKSIDLCERNRALRGALGRAKTVQQIKMIDRLTVELQIELQVLKLEFELFMEKRDG